MEIAILTSSRADFGFYKPLLNLLNKSDGLNYKLVVFGTHLSIEHGFTINDIKASGYTNISKVDAIPSGYQPEDITKMIGNTHIKFGEYWNNIKFDLIICIGDRYEMYAAVSSAIPFNIPIAHISGGEETLGAIDNIYRHSLTLMSKYHFTNTEKNAERVKEITGSSNNVFHTGSLAIDNINQTKLYNTAEFKNNFKFDLDCKFILFTFHPETTNYRKNEEYANVIYEVLTNLEYSVMITMPNADTMGDVIREMILKSANNNSNIYVYESLGSKGYYSALNKCMLVLGNSSSGIIEAASFSKYVLNIGGRQKGRECGNNVLHCEINKSEILRNIEQVKRLPKLNSKNIYGDGNSGQNIINKLLRIKAEL